MPTVVTHTLRASGGDYTTMSAWEAGEQRDLVALDEQEVLECYNDWPGGLVDNCTVAGWTTDSTRDITITVLAGHRHNGVLGDGFYMTTASSWAACIRFEEVGTVEWIDARHTGGQGYGLRGSGSSLDIAFKNCFAAGPHGGFAALNSEHVLINCIAYDSGDGFTSSNYGKTLLQNCGAFDCTTGFNFIHWATAQNCVAFGNTTGFGSTGTWGYGGSLVTHNASSDSTEPGVNPITTDIVSGDFSDETANDWSVSGAGSALYDAGYDLSAEFTDDIAGNARGATFDVGPFEYASVSSATLSGTLSGRGSLSSGISTQILLNGDFAARAAVAGDLSTEILLLGGPSGLAQLSGDILTQVLLNAITTGSATLSAGLSAGNEILLAGDIAGAALINADIATQVLLEAGLSAEAALTAELLTQIALAGGLTGSATVSGNLTVGSVIALSGAVSGEASLTAELLTDILLSAAVAGQATVVGALTIPADDLQAAISGTGTITGTLDTGILMSGALAGSASITGLIITEQMQDVVGIITLATQTSRIALVTKTPKITLH